MAALAGKGDASPEDLKAPDVGSLGDSIPKASAKGGDLASQTVDTLGKSVDRARENAKDRVL